MACLHEHMCCFYKLILGQIHVLLARIFAVLQMDFRPNPCFACNFILDWSQPRCCFSPVTLFNALSHSISDCCSAASVLLQCYIRLSHSSLDCCSAASVLLQCYIRLSHSSMAGVGYKIRLSHRYLCDLWPLIRHCFSNATMPLQ